LAGMNNTHFSFLTRKQVFYLGVGYMVNIRRRSDEDIWGAVLERWAPLLYMYFYHAASVFHGDDDVAIYCPTFFSFLFFSLCLKFHALLVSLRN
jgi:hypothetical protein